MARIDTLTAYILKFNYMQRNNPLIDEQRDAIKAGKSPEYTFSNFVDDYTIYSSKLAIGKNSDRAILLSREDVSKNKINVGTIRWHLRPQSGKQGKPITVMKIPTQKQYNFGSDSAALYDHHVFVYENATSLVAIFHRQNGSGCKSVFLETANKILKSKGLKLEMDLYVPMSDAVTNATPTKITLQFTRPVVSSDIADNYRGTKKQKQVIRDLGLNLEVSDNNKIFKIFRNMQFGKISRESAFAQIKAECQNAEEFNDAEIKLRIGKRHKTVQWNEFEHLLGNHDISQPLSTMCQNPKDFIPVLTKLADEYYSIILRAEDPVDAI